MRPLHLAAAAVAVLVAWAADARSFRLVPDESSILIHVGKHGPLSSFAHEHDVSEPAFTGEVRFDPRALEGGSVTARFDARRLTVVPDREPKDAPKVQATMRGPEVLDTERYPSARFTSRRCVARESGPGEYEVQVQGELELHGVTRPLSLPMHVTLSGDRLSASGRAVLRQTDFGIKPLRLFGGGVTVADEITVQLKLTARAGSER